MKKGILINSLIVVGMYLACVFISLEPSILKWDDFWRGIFTAFCLVAIFFYWTLIHDDRK
jgi:hypothetical protein